MSQAVIALIGLLTGLLAGLISFLGLWAISAFMARTFDRETQPKLPWSVLILSLILKLPALFFGWQLNKSLGNPGPVAFGLGIMLVYSLAVVRVTLKPKTD